MNNRAIKQNIAMHENMLAVNKSNIRLSKLPIEEKTKREIKNRLVRGLAKSDKEKFTAALPELQAKIKHYFEQNPNAVRCPFKVYSPIIRGAGVKTTIFQLLVLRNDYAIERWENKADEWAEFSENGALSKVRALKQKLQEAHQEGNMPFKFGSNFKKA